MSLMESISGKLYAKNPTEAIVDIGGIRFRIHITVSAYDSLPGQEKSVELLTYLHVKEDILDLYGFKDHVERSLFMNLNTISLLQIVQCLVHSWKHFLVKKLTISTP